MMHLMDGPLSPQGVSLIEKIAYTRKTAEINCAKVHLKKCLLRLPLPCYARFGELKKNFCSQWRKKICKHSVDGRKQFPVS